MTKTGKPLKRRNFLQGVGLAGAGGVALTSGCLGSFGGSGDFPSQSIRMVIPFPEGSSVDVYDRLVWNKMGELYDVTVEFDYVTGALGIKGVTEVANSEPDGYTVGHLNSPAAGAYTIRETPFDLLNLAYIGAFAPSTWVMVANSDTELSTFEDVAQAYRDGQYSDVGGLPVTSAANLMWEIFKANEEYNIPWENYVAYGGSGNTAQAVITGEVPTAIIPATTAEKPVKDGQMIGVASMATRGSSALPDLPDPTEYGYPSIDYLGELYNAFFCAPDTPDDRIQTHGDTLEEALNSDELQQWSEETGNPVDHIAGPEETRAKLETTRERIKSNLDLSQFRN